MRSHRRRLPIDHVMIAGSVGDLDAIQALLALLPETAYGQIFIEDGAGAADLSALRPPARMTLARLRATDADRGDGAPELVLARKGTQLAVAIEAWAAEWIPDEPVVERITTMWVGSRDSESVNALCDRLPETPERL
jgi:hypothetical protein